MAAVLDQPARPAGPARPVSGTAAVHRRPGREVERQRRLADARRARRRGRPGAPVPGPSPATAASAAACPRVRAPSMAKVRRGRSTRRLARGPRFGGGRCLRPAVVAAASARPACVAVAPPACVGRPRACAAARGVRRRPLPRPARRPPRHPGRRGRLRRRRRRARGLAAVAPPWRRRRRMPASAAVAFRAARVVGSRPACGVVAGVVGRRGRGLGDRRSTQGPARVPARGRLLRDLGAEHRLELRRDVAPRLARALGAPPAPDGRHAADLAG